jgi:hypothetical protein
MDIVEILKIGLPGLVFLLSLLSYQLLSKEQQKPKPSATILRSIKQFMYINIFLALLTASAPLVTLSFSPETSASSETSIYYAIVRPATTNLDSGKAAVCVNAEYSGRYILITDSTNQNMIQVYALGILPCQEGNEIALNIDDASKLHVREPDSTATVNVAAAEEGQMFILLES